MDYKNPGKPYVSFYDMTGSDEKCLDDEEFRLWNDRRMKIAIEGFDVNNEMIKFKTVIGRVKPPLMKEATVGTTLNKANSLDLS